jgi:hypothetical protein
MVEIISPLQINGYDSIYSGYIFLHDNNPKLDLAKFGDPFRLITPQQLPYYTHIRNKHTTTSMITFTGGNLYKVP